MTVKSMANSVVKPVDPARLIDLLGSGPSARDQRRAGLGYAVTIDSIVAHTVGAVLHATEILPGAHCDISTSTSAPVHMVHAPGHPPVVEWRVAPVRRDCAP